MPPRPLKLVMLNGALFEPSLLDGIKQIEIEVAVNEYGRVTAAQPSTADQGVSPILTGAAVAAAKQWVFDPAKIGGHNVAAKHAIVFRFAPR